MASQVPSAKKEVIVIGAGVVGLTTALEIQATGKYKVTIIAEILPNDPKSIKYTSQWAGAHHIFNEITDEELHKMESETFEKFWKLSEPGSEAEECFLRVPQTEYFKYKRAEPEPLAAMPNFKQVPENTLPPGVLSAVQLSSTTIDVPIYLNYLLAQFTAAGGIILRGFIQHINQVIEGGASLFPGGAGARPPDAVVVCAGIGARFLGGVEDTSVYPIRGQTVIIRAPWLRFGRTVSSEDSITYIIPRRSGDAVVGGTRIENDWFPSPRPETTRDILERAVALCPELVPPEIRTQRKPTVDDVLPHVVGEGCGLRPARKGGVRLEIEWTEGVGGRGRVPIVHSYGHSGFGYQSSWGSASRALKLLEKALGEVS